MKENNKLRIVFMGTPEIAVTCLDRLVGQGCNIVSVVTRIDKPQGRHAVMTPPPVKVYAQEHGIPVLQPRTLRDEAFAQWLREIDPDLILVVAFGMILPKNVLDYPKYGCLNVHTSLLPKYRGAAPMQRAIMAGEKETGVTVMYMDEGLDTGDMIYKTVTPISEDDNLETVHDRLADLGADLLLKAVFELEKGNTLPREVQNGELSNYAAKIEREDCHLDFHRPASELDCIIRGLSPIPLSYFVSADGKAMKVISAKLAKGKGEAGTVLDMSSEGAGFIRIACGEGAIDLIRILPEGKSRMNASDFLRGKKLQIGEKFAE